MKFLRRKNTNNLLLLDIKYTQPRKSTDWKDCLTVIYRDCTTNSIELEIIHEPLMEIFFVKEEFRDYNYNKDYMNIDKCYSKIVKYKDIEFEIAKEAGGAYLEEHKALTQQRRYYERKNMHRYPYVFGSDLNIVDYYRIQWNIEYGNDNLKITKAYLDIEIDAYELASGYGESGQCPINAVTIINEENLSSYTFLLRNDKNPQIAEFENDISSFYNELHDEFDEFYGKFEYNIYMYDDEINLIKSVFQLINTLKPNFCMIWNMSFDIPYFINRLNTLGYDHVDIMTSKDMEYRTAYFKLDKKNYNIADKTDYFNCSSYTNFIDQMVLYAGIRKGQKTLRELSLNYTATNELGDTKLDYSSEANMKTFAYINYRKFVMYNIKDVLLQYGIERRTCDVDTFYIRSKYNNVNYEKVFKQTVFLNNIAYFQYFKNDKIKGNNANMMYGDVTEDVLDINYYPENVDIDEGDKKFKGALVADPVLNEPVGTKLMGICSKYIHDNVVDEDFSSMYPWIIITLNISKNSMIGKIIVLFIPESKKDEEKYDTGQDFIDNMLCDNHLYLGSKWLNLPELDEICDIIDSELEDMEVFI